ncbi:uncharacterized protein FOBCDRAFT_6001 [Fusarium oxysporum Fo47]|uniref:uncharacterized protein n=1 Tax=Fusarium oxysporum Fo47 TaxID=660027 RepID=UPI002869AB75|nr:uncharacterized protein FOBCDRAFT_6001 [Fusarium oxysporum Fo47]QKD47756.2 hypothetical protein FOBCDRAFT_6001 [Fusarium oxysporum Fo47]
MTAKSYDTGRAQGWTRLLSLGHQRCSEPQHKGAVALDLLSCFCFVLSFSATLPPSVPVRQTDRELSLFVNFLFSTRSLSHSVFFFLSFLLLLLLLLLFKHAPRSTNEVAVRSLFRFGTYRPLNGMVRLGADDQARQGKAGTRIRNRCNGVGCKGFPRFLGSEGQRRHGKYGDGAIVFQGVYTHLKGGEADRKGLCCGTNMSWR